MSAFNARYFDGKSSRACAVQVLRTADGQLEVQGDGVERRVPLAEVSITPRLARTSRSIVFADGARLQVEDDDELERWFPHRNRLQRLVDRLERHAHAVAASIVLCVVMGYVTVVWGVPWMADRIAAAIPPGVESRLGSEVLDQLDSYFGFDPSQIPAQRQAELGKRFNALIADLPDHSGYRLEFRNAEDLGPNALAIPGGTIVVTDQLLERIYDDREFDAVVAHEIGHQQHRHALRQTLRSSFVVVLAALFTGDVSSASTVVVAIPTFLLQSHYSRGFESESDEFAFKTLAAHRISPAWFAEAIRSISFDPYAPDFKARSDNAYLSSHPSDESRIEAAQAAGAAFLAEHPDLFRETPEYDPCVDEGVCHEEPEPEPCSPEACEAVDGSGCSDAICAPETSSDGGMDETSDDAAAAEPASACEDVACMIEQSNLDPNSDQAIVIRKHGD